MSVSMDGPIEAFNVQTGESWFERKLKPTKINARYPIKGKALLYTTCAFGSLGDALFGYNSGMVLARSTLRYILVE
jgi:hypothetical protein